MRSVRGNATTLDDPPPIDANSDAASQLLDSAADEGFGDGQDPSYGIHGVLKKTDYWFNLELNLLEKSAREEADAHARAGLPRADVPLLEELPAETVLRERARRVYLDWSERVRRSLSGAYLSLPGGSFASTRPNLTTTSIFGLCASVLCAPLAWADYVLMLAPAFVARQWHRLDTAELTERATISMPR